MRLSIGLSFGLLLIGLQGIATADDPWADAVLDYHAINPNLGFDTPAKALGEPAGGGSYAPNNTSLHSLGHPGAAPGSFLLLKFNTPVTNDPLNPMGLDCIVFGNSFWTGGDPHRKWIEPALIEISQDVNGNGLADDPWYVIPGSRNLGASMLPLGMPNPDPPLAGSVFNAGSAEADWGYAELNPTQRKHLDNYVRPDDPFAAGLSPRSGGGDAFDIAWAVPVDGSGRPEGIQQFDFIRLSAFIVGSIPPFGNVTPEIDAAADVAPHVDVDEDGILDEYETRVAGTDPARPESTVLALEIPPEDGGSPAGALLGTASDAMGNRIALYASGLRTGIRPYNCTVDIQVEAAPPESPPGLKRAATARVFSASEADFAEAQIQPAQFTIAYAASDITGLDEAALSPWRYEGATYTQSGIEAVTRDPVANAVTFRSVHPGHFVLAAPDGAGDLADGVPIAPVQLHLVHAGATAPGPVAFRTAAVVDALGHALPDGTTLTVVAEGGTFATADAADAPGHQVMLWDGIAQFAVLLEDGLAGDTRALSLTLYAEPDNTRWLGEYTGEFRVVQMPLALAIPLAAALLAAGTMRLRRAKRGK